MKIAMNANEVCYRRITSAIGVTMLVFLLLLNGFGLVLSGMGILLQFAPISEEVYYAVYNVFYAAGYLFSFMMPVAVLKGLIRKNGYLYYPMKTDIRLSPYLIPAVLGGIALIWTQSYINAGLVSVFDYSAFSSAVLWGEGEPVGPLDVVIQFLVIGMVPAFCEEFLFRGAILSNCLPFGRGKAIFISALLFGLMHQNAEQILYAFAAGVLLGFVYERTGSIWNCTMIHLANNFLSFAMSIAADRLGGRVPGLAYAALEAALCLVGFACLAILVKFLSEKRPRFESGVFGRSVPASDSYAACPIEPKRAFQLFLSPPNVMFFAFTALQILMLIGMALLYRYVAL